MKYEILQKKDLLIPDVALVRIAGLPYEILKSLEYLETSEVFRKIIELEQRLEVIREPLRDYLFRLVGEAPKELRQQALVARRRLGVGFESIENVDNLSMGAGPLKPFFEEWQNLIAARKLQQTQFETSLKTESQKALSKIFELPAQNDVSKILLTSSSDLFDAGVRLCRKQFDLPVSLDKSGRQFIKSFFKLISKCCTKTSPRGFICGLNLIDFSDRPKHPSLGFKKRLTLLSPLVSQMARILSVSFHLDQNGPHRLNPSVYYDQNQILVRLPPDKPYKCQIIEANVELRAILDSIKTRSQSRQQVILDAAERMKIPLDQLSSAYQYLLDNGVIVYSSLDVPYDQWDGLNYLNEALKQIHDRGPEFEKQRAAINGVFNFCSLEIDFDCPAKKNYIADLQSQVAGVGKLLGTDFSTADLSMPIVVDTVVPVGNQMHLTDAVKNDFVSAVQTLAAIQSRLPLTLTPSVRIQRILERAGIQDSDWKDNFLPLAGIPDLFGERLAESEPEDTALRRLFERWINQDPFSRAEALDLEADGLWASLMSLPQLRAEGTWGATEAVFRVASPSHESLINGDFKLFIEGLAGHPFGYSLRYASLLSSPHLDHQVQRLVEWSGRDISDALCTIPVSNLNRFDTAKYQPAVGKTIETYGIKLALPDEKIIPLCELYLKKQGADYELWRCMSHGKQERLHPLSISQIRPDIPYSSIRILRLLGTGYGSASGLSGGLNSPGILPRLSYRPRITRGRIVLSLREWRFSLSEILPILSLGEKSAFEIFNRWRIAYKLPDHVFVRLNHEQPFFVSFASGLSVEVFLGSLTEVSLKSPAVTVVVQEMFPDPSNLWLQDSANEVRVAEFVAPLGFRLGKFEGSSTSQT